RPRALSLLPSLPTRRSSDLVRREVDLHRADVLVRQRTEPRARAGTRAAAQVAAILDARRTRERRVHRPVTQVGGVVVADPAHLQDRKSTRLNSSHVKTSYAV